MSIVIDDTTRVIVQGITGRDGSFHAGRMLDYGTKVVAGVSPGKGGSVVHGVPVFDNFYEAAEKIEADASIIFVPAQHAVSALYEAADSGAVKLVVCITEKIPALDMAKVYHYYRAKSVGLLGPNCPGIISPGKSLLGIMPGEIFKRGSIGVVSRSGTLTYEIVHSLSKAGFGQSSCVGLGGDSIVGMSFVDILEEFQDDDETEAVVLIGEIGGDDEQRAAIFIKSMTKPVVAYVAGVSAPKEQRMGHAGAIVFGGGESAHEKIEAFRDASIPVAKRPSEAPELLARIFTK
ncbi:MAG TPA: succinate--CoA ligase subunit alpha [candidate division Zixibacteria bacterium]|nr:succinate--CoA ligase subunit alpha [candidate division Zixibacteria bacterium]